MIWFVRYGSRFGFLGLHIVQPAFRGRGYGLRLWNAGMARLAGRCIGLDGVAAQQANYRRSGFQLAYRKIRHQGTAGPVFIDMPEPNALALAMARRHGLTAAFETARMYAGECAPRSIERVFGVTSFGLG